MTGNATNQGGFKLQDCSIIPLTGTAVTITNATNATPIQITATSHGYSTGQTVKIAGVGGNTNANGTWVITVVDANNFTLNGSAGNAAYTSGGTSGSIPARHGINFDPSNGNPMSNMEIIHNNIQQLGGRAILFNNPTLVQNGIFTSTIEDNVLNGGINLFNAGDSMNILKNTITGGFNGIDIQLWNPAVPIIGNGAAVAAIKYNNITSQGCMIRLIQGQNVRIEDNNIEKLPPAGAPTTSPAVLDTSNCPNNAIIDLDGIAGNGKPTVPILRGNLVCRPGNTFA